MLKNNKRLQIGVVGSAGSNDNGNATKQMSDLAKEVGRFLAEKNAIVISGGKDGIMEAVGKGVKSKNGLSVGIISGQRFSSNDFIDVEILSGAANRGLDEYLLVNMCDGLIVIGGGAGTLQEIAITYRNNKPVVLLKNSGGWADKIKDQYLDQRNLVKILTAKTPVEAVDLILNQVNHNTSS